MTALGVILSGIFLIMLGLSTPVGKLNAGDLKPMRITTDTTERNMKLGLNKSLTIHLPRAAKDVVVGNPEMADAVVRTPHRIFVIGKKVGQTNIFFFDADGKKILNLELQIERDLSILNSMLIKLLPSSDIKLESINDNVVLTGTVPNPSQAKKASDLATRFIGKPEQVVNMLAIEGKEQVLLRVTVAEVQRSIIKQLGVDLTNTLGISNAVFNFNTVNPFSLAGQALSGATGTGTYTSGTDSVGATLRAMERNGLIRTLAEPNLTAISGESAKFLAGGEFPVPSSRDSEGNVIIEFKPFGVGLGFTPVVLSEGRISLKVSTEVSETTSDNAFTLNNGTNGNLTIPGLKVRRAETTVELPSGGSLVMAGLIQEDTKRNLNGVPGIKDVPILGALFRSSDFQKTETELAVIITPYVVSPTSREALTRPDKGLVEASDLEATLFGRLNKVYGVRSGKLPNGKYRGNFGFIHE